MQSGSSEEFVSHLARREIRRELFLQFANSLSVLSTCERLQVGCVITNVEMTKVLAIGYNGNAKGLSNRCDRPDEPGNCGCIHAEMNALLKVDGSIPEKILFTSVSPCVQCAKAIINAGVGAVYYGACYRDSEGAALLGKAKIGGGLLIVSR
jgi:dCMP deaminase